MNKMNLITLFLILFIVTGCMVELCQCTNSSSNCKEAERNALLKFKKSLNDPSGKLSSWQGMSCCDWEGVGCNPNIGYVVKVDLHSIFQYRQMNFDLVRVTNMLGASKLDSSLLELRYLNYLDLSGNNFSGSPIPEFLGNLKDLKYLNLSYANFNPNIFSPHLGNLTNLQVFDVSSVYSYQLDQISDHFTQSFEWLSTLSSLKGLYMDSVNLSKVRNLLPILNKLPFLSVLSLSYCQLNDAHLSPTTYSNLAFFSSIQELYLGWNSFLLFPPLLKNMSSLGVLDLSSNFFNSSIPTWLTDLNDLEHLDLSHNYFIEVESGLWGILSGLCHLKTFDLSANNFQQESLASNKNISLGCISYDLEVLNAKSSGLTGVLPDELCRFKKLKILDLSNNALHGSIHALIGNLTSLIEINLGSNELNGTIPASLGNLSSLYVLGLEYNHLYGAIPTTIENLSALTYLSLSNNQLSGVLPDESSQLKKLKHIDLSYNALHGTIHALIGNLTGLIEINLESNQFNGTIPASLGNLLSLRELFLRNNSLYGAIPTIIGNLSALSYLDLSSNQLSGDVPESIGQLVNLGTFDISSNKLTGNISKTHFLNVTKLSVLSFSSNQLTITFAPDWIPPFQLNEIYLRSCKHGTVFPRWVGTQKKLNILFLSNASITGPWPTWFQSSLLDTLDLSHNQISGNIPHNIADLLPVLGDLYLSNNRVNGTIPSSFCKLENLRNLDISRNMLSGEIPNCWENTSHLSTLKLSFNKLTGAIPRSIGNHSELRWLQLNNNRLKGEISSSLSDCDYLFFVNLANNEFSGSISTWIGEMKNLTWLQYFVLRNNSFEGYIPKQLCQMDALQILDVAYNNFMGSIPNCLGSLTAMTYQHLTDINYDHRWEGGNEVMIKRMILEYKSSLRLVVNIDMSSNHLTGVIPPGLTILSQLLGLNLSNNYLIGTIPKNIGNLTALESFDLSNNQLTGIIPIELSLLQSLSSLNLSYNNFSGPIPTGNQLQALPDPSIYAGNPNLCGFPLPECYEPVHVPGTTNEEEDDEEEDKSDKIWLYLSISIGYAFGLWAFFGTLMFKREWRYAYFRYADYARDWIYVFIVVNARRLRRKLMGVEE